MLKSIFCLFINIGDRYWIFHGNTPISGHPKEGMPLTELGLPADVKKVDAAFVWGFNNRTYIISGDMYWKLNERNNYIEPDYPRDMSIWRKVPVPLDSAFNYWNGKIITSKIIGITSGNRFKIELSENTTKPQ